MPTPSTTLNRQGTLPAAAPENDEAVTDLMPRGYGCSDTNDADFQQMMDGANALNRAKTKGIQ